MKKYILTLMSVVLLSGCQFFNQTEKTTETPVEESSSVQVKTEVEHVTVTVEEKDGKFYCPVKDANLESPNAVCKMCIAEQLEF